MSFIPLKHGAAQLGFWALQKNPEPLALVPLHISYRYVQPEQLFRGLAPLEKRLGLIPSGSEPERLRQCGLQVLTNLEKEYQLSAANRTTDERRKSASWCGREIT